MRKLSDNHVDCSHLPKLQTYLNAQMKKHKILLAWALTVLLSGCATQQPQWEANKIAESLLNAERTYNAGNYAEAAKIFRLLAQQGNVYAQSELGMMYTSGLGVPQDYKEAVKWLRLAAEQGDTKAQFNLGFMYSQGEVVTRDCKEALKWLRLAAEQGNIKAQYGMGVMRILQSSACEQNQLDLKSEIEHLLQ